MLFKFFVAQWENPSKQDWTEKVREDLVDLRIKASLIEMKLILN